MNRLNADADSAAEPSMKHNYECEIKTEIGKRVIERFYQLPKKLEDLVEVEINKLLKKGYITESKSTWLNNLRPVLKEDGSVRVTTNPIALNKLVELDNYSLPNIDNILNGLRNAKFFSKIDLKDGFFQVPLAKGDRHKTAFRFRHRLYEWTVMPMGFKSAPAIFQRFMDSIFKEEIGNSCYIYVDDILIFGDTEESHNEAYEKVLRKIKDYGLDINQKKSIYKVERIEFLGHVLTYNKIMPKDTRIAAVSKLNHPINIKSLQEFLGMVNYYRKFIKNCAYLSAPLYDLLKDKQEFKWEEKHEECFKKLKNALIKTTCLIQPDYSRPFIIETDACNYGIGAILSQEQDGEIYPIIYASRELRENELKYSVSEKECLAAIWAMETFKYYIYGKEFKLITDHKAFESLNNGDIKSLIIQRWMDRLKEYSYTIEYKKGKEIPYVDALSRLVTVNNITPINEGKIIDLELKRKIIMDKHEELFHRGHKMVASALRKIYDWTDMDKLVKEVVRKCVTCKKYNPKYKRQYIHDTSYFPGEKVAIDIIGPIQNSYIITEINYFTRKGWASVIKTRGLKESTEIY